MQRCLGILLLLILLVGCKEGPPAGVLKKDNMTNILYDIHLSEGYLYTSAVDSMRQKTADFNEGIYQHYQTDSVTVRQSLEYYASRPQVLQDIYNDIQGRLKKVEDGLRTAEEERYRSVFVTDSIKRAAEADSLNRIVADSIRMEQRKYMLYWKNADSVDLKPKPWSWENALKLPFFPENTIEVEKNEIAPDTLVTDTIGTSGLRPAPTVE